MADKQESSLVCKRCGSIDVGLRFEDRYESYHPMVLLLWCRACGVTDHINTSEPTLFLLMTTE